MRISILIPHYKTGKMTAYCISQLYKLKGRHEIEVIVINNSASDGLDAYKEFTQFYPCPEHLRGQGVTYLEYPLDKMQSHGLAFDYAIEQGFVKTDYFITLESDAFPTQDNWLDYYENLINEGYDMAGSCMKLSGGEYIHPAGAMYKKSNWIEAKELVDKINLVWNYYPNAIDVEGFNAHLMIHTLSNTEPYNRANLITYKPIAESVFHQGMAFNNEKLATYGQRTIQSETGTILYPMTGHYISSYSRMGYEPGQWFSYWHYATGKKVKQIPTEIHWMDNRRNQQQEYTLMENGLKHLWAISAYHGMVNADLKDIIDFKANQMESLYNSIK